MSIVIKSINPSESVVLLPIGEGNDQRKNQTALLSVSTIPEVPAAAPGFEKLQGVEARVLMNELADVTVKTIMPDKVSEELMLQSRVAELQETAQKKGYEDGLKHARETVEQEWRPRIKRLTAILDALERDEEQVLASLEEEIVSLVFEATCRIVGKHFASQAAIKEAVQQGLSTLEKGTLVVRLAPADYAMLATELPAQLMTSTMNLRVTEDSRVALGGCILESNRGILDARLEVQMERLRQSLLDARNASASNAMDSAPA